MTESGGNGSRSPEYSVRMRHASSRQNIMHKYLAKSDQLLERAGIKQDVIDKYRSEKQRQPDEQS